MKKILTIVVGCLLLIGAGCQKNYQTNSAIPDTVSVSTSSFLETQTETPKQELATKHVEDVEKKPLIPNLKPTINSVPNGSVYCNGKYWTACEDDNKLICPDTGDAYCQEPAVNNQNIQQSTVPPNSQPVTPPANTLFCNGKYWSECPDNGKFICPATGDDPSCLTLEQQVAQQQAAQAAAAAQLLEQQQLQALQAKQAQQQALYTDYQNKVAAIEQQIVILKQDYYTKKAAIEKQTIAQRFIDGQIAKLTDDTNQQINELQLQEQQLYLDYQRAISQL